MMAMIDQMILPVIHLNRLLVILIYSDPWLLSDQQITVQLLSNPRTINKLLLLLSVVKNYDCLVVLAFKNSLLSCYILNSNECRCCIIVVAQSCMLYQNGTSITLVSSYVILTLDSIIPNHGKSSVTGFFFLSHCLGWEENATKK